VTAHATPASMRGAARMLFAVCLITGISLSIAGAHARPGGDELGWKSFSAARADARESKRKVLVDVYTTWCGWCKKMDRDVYGNAAVRAYLQEHFEVAKLDAESADTQTVDDAEHTGREIASAMGVSSYPTTVFFSDNGEMITAVPGYTSAESFLQVLEYIHGEKYKTQSWNEFRSSKGK
jgi:thioredoxin-related protein